MVKPYEGTSEKVRARVLELTGEDPGEFQIKDIFPGPEYHTKTPEEIVEHLAQSMVRGKEGLREDALKNHIIEID